MGQQPSDLPQPRTPPPQLQPIDGDQGLFLNLRSGRVYIRNDLKVGSIQDISYELQIYKFRRLNDNYVVSVDYCSIDTEKDMCSAFTTLDYYIEKQEYTLFDKQEINKHQGCKIIQQVLKSFDILYQQFGYFTPNSKMISFNRMHHPKGWIHEDPKVTRNTQNMHCPKNISLENKLVREIVKLFDSLRDPSTPMFRYSDCLPNHLLTFHIALQIFLRKEVEVENTHMRVSSPFCEIQNIRKCVSPPIEKITFRKPVISMASSPLHSPRMTTRVNNNQQRECRLTAKVPKMKIVYCSPPPQNKEPEEDLASFRDSVKTSLKKTSSNSHLCHNINPSRDFGSTMPTSLRNSRIEDKQVCIQILTPVISSNSIVNPQNLDNINLRKRATQRFSEVEPASSFGRYFAKGSKCQETYHPFLMEQSEVNIESVPPAQTQKMQAAKTQGVSMTANTQELSFRKDFQTHKRHKTDYKILAKKTSSIGSSFNQKSAIEGTIMDRFNCNTIKSIHLLEEDKELDSEIINDLKHIINKYKLQH